MKEIKNPLEMSICDLLQYALSNSIIDTSHIPAEWVMGNEKDILKNHAYRIWTDKNGRYCTYLPDKEKPRKRRLIRRKTKESLEKELIAYYKKQKEDDDVLTVEEIFYDWINAKLRRDEISKSTYDRYICDYNRYFSDFGRKKINQVTEMDVENFLLDTISEYKLSAKAYAGLRLLIYGIFRRAKKLKLVSFSVVEVVEDIDISPKIFARTRKEDNKEVFMEDETIKLLNYLKSHIDMENLGILLLYCTGIRVGELVTIKTSEVKGNTIAIRRTESRCKDDDGHDIYIVKEHPKTDAGIRDVIVPDSYLWVLGKIKELNPSGEYLMSKNGERMHTYLIRKRLYRICDKLHIQSKSPHKIRKTYGSILLDNNVDTTMIIEQMGHTDISCTENHYHRNRKDDEKKSKILSSLPEFV